jgi:DNA-binding transcriptional MerR regulator
LDLTEPSLGFVPAQAARLGGCTRSQLGHWRRSGVVVPSEADGRYSFRDLVGLRVVVSLLEAGLPMVRVKAALAVLRTAGDQAGSDRAGSDPASKDLAGLRIVTDGVSVFACYDDGQILDALRNGQLALFVAVDRFASALDADIEAFTVERDAFLARLRSGSHAAVPDRVPSDRRDDDEAVVGGPVVARVGVAR